MLPLLVSMTVLAGYSAAATAPAPAQDPTYLVILDQPAHFSADYPVKPPSSQRQIGWGKTLFTLNTPVDGLRKQVEDALDTTEKTGYPLLLHLDDWNFPPPSTDPDWVEWTGWPKPGETHGPLVKRRWVNWGTWIVTGRPPDYESPKFRAFMHKQLEDGVLKTLVPRVERWRKEGRGYLFAGLVVGWETGYYSMTAQNPPPTVGKDTFNDSDVVTTGYAALTRLGWTAARLAKEAKAQGITQKALFRKLMCGVVHDYSEYLCRICVDAGLPRDRIYTHYTPYATVAPAAQIAEDGRLLPLSTAINPYSRPGYTMTKPWADAEKVVAAVHKAGRQDWGAVELEVVPAVHTEKAFLDQLDWLSGHGAKVMCLFGWWEAEGSMFGVKGTGAVAAMKDWLAGKAATPAKPADAEAPTGTPRAPQ